MEAVVEAVVEAVEVGRAVEVAEVMEATGAAVTQNLAPTLINHGYPFGCLFLDFALDFYNCLSCFITCMLKIFFFTNICLINFVDTCT